MRIFKSLLTVFLALIIVGGLGYIGWSMFLMPMNNSGIANMPSNTSTPSQQTQNNNQQSPNMSGMNMEPNTSNSINQQNSMSLNTIAIQNKDKINQAIGTINQAIELISIDPYAKTTVPNTINGNTEVAGTSQSQGNGTINIYAS